MEQNINGQWEEGGGGGWAFLELSDALGLEKPNYIGPIYPFCSFVVVIGVVQGEIQPD